MKKTNFFLENFKTKTPAFYIGCVFAVLSLVQAFIYLGCKSNQLPYNSLFVVYSVLAFALFVVFSMFRQTSQLAPISVMVFNFLCLTAVATSDGFIDYVSTAFFSGVSLKAILSLTPYVYLPLIFLIVNFIASSILMYFPQNRKLRDEAVIKGIKG